ncbi:hypothetical protein RB195_005862 [Necator americanus]|uniref:Uncharacterized protein n=1 Tax=Necator americanus TaxID=51031 RepID=A0ABR1BPY8_NECAM
MLLLNVGAVLTSTTSELQELAGCFIVLRGLANTSIRRTVKMVPADSPRLSPSHYVPNGHAMGYTNISRRSYNRQSFLEKPS